MTDRPTVAADSPVARANVEVILDFFSVVDGRIAEHWHVVDNAALGSLLG